MATFSISTYFTLLVFLFFHFNSLPISSFSFETFDKDPIFDSKFALFGDAKLVSNGSKLQLTSSVGSSAGRVIYKKPFKFLEGNPAKLVSFSSYVSFLMSPDKGDGLAFMMVPSGFNVSEFGNSSFGFGLESEKSDLRFVAVEFDTSRDQKYGDFSDNHVGIDVSGFVSVKARNVTSINSVLNNGKKLHAWIDYIAASKRLEVRLSQFGDIKPMDPMLSHPIDLSKMWNDEEVLIGFSSANRNSSQSQACFIYSWSFKQWSFPHWMHSQPLDPQAFTKDAKPVIAHKKTDCLSKVLAAMIFGSACGALGAFIVLYLWTIFSNRRPVAPEECSSVHPVDFEYKKVKVVVDKTVEDGKQVAV